MNKTTGKISSTNVKTTSELTFELKYCERCGGLWLRPAGGDQTYCVGCGRAMAELPAPLLKTKTKRMPRSPRWGGNEGTPKNWERDVESEGGVA
jgi:hypothetical protein